MVYRLSENSSLINSRSHHISENDAKHQIVPDLQLPFPSVSITTDVVSSNLDQGEVYNIMW